MRTRGHHTRSTCSHGGAAPYGHLVLVLTLLVLGLLVSPVAARGPGNPLATSTPRYTITPAATVPGAHAITISLPEHLIDVMDPANAAMVCRPDTTITQTQTIDMGAYPLLAAGTIDTSPNANGAVINGTQIGTTTIPFLGIYSALGTDGRPRSIKNLRISGSGNGGLSDTDGLFGTIGCNGAVAALGVAGAIAGTVRDLVIENMVITSTAANVGCLAGTLANGTILRCGVQGIPGSGVTGFGPGNSSVGGLIGCVNELSPGVSLVAQCFSTASVIGPDDVGGLVGSMNFGAIRESYTAYHVVIRLGAWFATSVPGPEVGGFVGNNNQGVISGCYSDCAVPIVVAPVWPPAPVALGDFAGAWTLDITRPVLITNYCDATDSSGPGIGAPAPAGGWVGAAVVPVPDNNANLADGNGNMVSQTTYIGWVFNLFGPWSVDGVRTPRLLWQP